MNHDTMKVVRCHRVLDELIQPSQIDPSASDTPCCWAAAITHHDMFLNGSICQAATFFFFRIITWAVAGLGSFSNCMEGSSARFTPSDPGVGDLKIPGEI